MRQAAPTEVQQFQHLVEAGGVGGTGSADREDLLDIGTEDVGLDQGLAGAHPVLVAGNGVDLAVVGDPPERVGQRPRREGVGGEPGVHDAQRAFQPVVLQVEVEGLELRGGQHALVDEGLTGKAWEIDGFASGAVLAGALGAQFVLGALPDHVGLALQVHTGGAADEHLAEGGHRVAGQGTQRGIVGGYVAPADGLQTFGLDDLLDGLARGGRVAGRLRQKRDARGIRPLGGQVELGDRAQEGIWNLQQNARAVTAVRFGSGGTAVLEVQQGGDRLVHDVAAAAAVDVHHHGHATRIVLKCGVVQPDTPGHSHLTLHKLLLRGGSSTSPRPARDSSVRH